MELKLTPSIDADNPVEGDLQLEGGNLVWTTDLATEVAQRLRVRFRFFLGEWFLDTREGIPYADEILRKNPKGQTIRAIFTNAITTTQGVAFLERLDFTLDRSVRELVLSFVARLEDGSTFRSSQFGPFIVEF
ncbi:MAG: hypothetical protein KAT70_09085 [Thermoplasmata archaeon]|nr:hypothetical protein [Thermoplasmata archaeon]